MSLWQLKMDDAAHAERRKKALICAVLSYLLLLILVIITFMPMKKTVIISVPVSGRPATVRWSGRRFGESPTSLKLRRAGPTSLKPRRASRLDRRERRLGGQGRKVVKETVQQPEAKKKVEKILEKNKLKKSSKKENKSAVVAEKREKSPGKPAIIEKIVKKPVEKVIKKVVEAQVKEAETLPELHQQEAAVPAASDVVEIEVGNEEVPSDEMGTVDEAISRDEYALMGAVGRAWRPPRGLRAGLQARLVVAVSAQGRAERVDITESSHVPAYDIAARASLYRAEYPPVFWGKNITVVFGQTRK